MVDKKGSLNIWKIIKGDFNKIRNNTIAWIVIIGLTIVPSLYAWFNIAASWDPYGNTGNLKVAVASRDEGYSGELTSMSINIGDKILSSLRENDALDWVFTSEEEAVQGVRDGSYYAALVIPESFSRDMMSFFTEDVHRSDIIYYLNEKENAIAPKITDKGASAVKNQVDEIFARSISEIVLEIGSGVASLMEKGDANFYLNNFLTHFEAAGQEIVQTGESLENFALLLDSMAGIAQSSTELAKDMTSKAGNGQTMLDAASQRLNDDADKLKKVSDSIGSALDKAEGYYDSVAAELDEIIAVMDKGADLAVSELTKLQEGMDKLSGRFVKLAAALENLEAQIPNEQIELKTAVEKLRSDLDDLMARHAELEEKIVKLSSGIQTAQTDVRQAQEVCKQLREDLDLIRAEYVNNIEPQILAVCEAFVETNDRLAAVLDDLDGLAADFEEGSIAAARELDEIADALRAAAETMLYEGAELEKTALELRAALNSGESEKLNELLGNDTVKISSFLSAPVELDTISVYPVENYGSAMAPFYSVLSIWVGAIVLVAMLKVNLDEKRKTELEALHDYQAYLGRMVFFLVMGLLQSGLVCLGDLFFLEIQCEHPMYFLLAGWVSGIVFTIIMYTLTISFGDVGKAIAVVLLVIQVAGSGGTFPIEMTPKFFQNTAALMPFTYSMNAMRECIGGFYENTYWISLAYLSVYAAVFLFIGLVLRKPIIRLNAMFAEKLESTKLM